MDILYARGINGNNGNRHFTGQWHELSVSSCSNQLVWQWQFLSIVVVGCADGEAFRADSPSWHLWQWSCKPLMDSTGGEWIADQRLFHSI